MTGHETPQQLHEIELRAAALDPRTSPVQDVVDFALLCLEPAHKEDEAIELLEMAIQRDPRPGAAQLWLAYALLHVRMDAESVERARQILSPLIDWPGLAGAAGLLLAEVREEQGAGLDERIALLEASVEREPDWVSNRQDLAWAYSEAGRHLDAVRELKQAIGSIVAVDPSWDDGRRNFEESITGRAAAGTEARLLADIAELGK